MRIRLWQRFFYQNIRVFISGFSKTRNHSVLEAIFNFKKGKGSIGGDIHEGKRTLIVIRTLEVASEEDKKRLVEILDSHTEKEEELQEALNIINKYDGIAYAKKRAEELVEQAWKEVDTALPQTNAKTILKMFAEYLVDRKI